MTVRTIWIKNKIKLKTIMITIQTMKKITMKIKLTMKLKIMKTLFKHDQEEFLKYLKNITTLLNKDLFIKEGRCNDIGFKDIL